MAELPPFTERELRFVRELVGHQVRFLIVGLSAAALQGAPVVTQDVDLWFASLDDPNLTAALKQVGGAYVPPTVYTPPMLAGEGLELFDIVLRMQGLESFDEEWANAIELTVGDVVTRVLPLTRILASKRAADRPKDRLVVPVLEEVVALQAARSGGTGT
ncbi:MAG: hypothetical protein A3J29_23535 [Acidobacteria bacterium RIFCSPLOWO2_12_FULL_67_14b]|nr:MAG: hypothetical protein A3J29_23535 [Acidobacteria bacterium RIFCSPLOWO2_12_FULL_67_14b]